MTTATPAADPKSNPNPPLSVPPSGEIMTAPAQSAPSPMHPRGPDWWLMMKAFIRHGRKIASFADLHNVRTGCHGATDLSPVSMAAALHFGLSIPNFGIQEYMRHTEETDAVFPHAYTFADGLLHPGEQVGLGVEIDEALAAKHEYSRAYLPVNRLEDGSMYNW